MSLLALTFAPTTRDQVERAAYLRLWGKVDDASLPGLLAAMRQLGKIRLEGDEAAKHFEDLVIGITQRDGIESGDLHWCQVLPEATGSGEMREAQALDAAETRVENALDALCGRT